MIAADTGQTFVDNSTLKAVARCSTEDVLRHGYGYTTIDERTAMWAGIHAHEALAEYLKTGDRDTSMATFTRLYKDMADEQVMPDGRLTFENTSTILGEWMNQNPIAALPYAVNPDLVEIGFSIPLDDECVCGHTPAVHLHEKCAMPGCDCTGYRPGFVFWGRMDAVVKYQGGLYVLDHKTTGQISDRWLRGFRSDSQMSGYVWAAQETLGQPIAGVLINGIEFSKLPSDPTRKCGVHKVAYAECGILHCKFKVQPFQRTPSQLLEWRKTAMHLARRHRELMTKFGDGLEKLWAVRMQGQFHGACNFCSFSDFCATGRRPEMVESMLVYEPWQPFELRPKEAV